ncbi:replication fork protection component Swi3-domain-containing protein [Haematococcus lacustris]
MTDKRHSETAASLTLSGPILATYILVRRNETEAVSKARRSSSQRSMGIFDDDDDLQMDAMDASDDDVSQAPGANAKKTDQSKPAAIHPGPGPPEAAVKKRVAKPRPKLTIDVLTGEHGFANVFHKFPVVFRSQFRGKGHEVSDLQRLLEMYSRWQQRVFPHCAFDDFVTRLEKLSSSHMLKVELRNLRQGLITLLDSPEELAAAAPPAPQPTLAAALAAGTGTAGNVAGPLGKSHVPSASGPGPRPGAAGSSGMGGSAAPVSRPAPAPLPPDFDDDEDEELMAMQAEAQWAELGLAGSAELRAVWLTGWLKDEEAAEEALPDLDMWEQAAGGQPPAHARTGTAAAQPVPTSPSAAAPAPAQGAASQSQLLDAEEEAQLLALLKDQQQQQLQQQGGGVLAGTAATAAATAAGGLAASRRAAVGAAVGVGGGQQETGEALDPEEEAELLALLQQQELEQQQQGMQGTGLPSGLGGEAATAPGQHAAGGEVQAMDRTQGPPASQAVDSLDAEEEAELLQLLQERELEQAAVGERLGEDASPKNTQLVRARMRAVLLDEDDDE